MKMAQEYVQLVEVNLPSISYQEQIPEYSEISSLESVNLSKDESFKEPTTINLEQAPISLQINSMEIDNQVSYSEKIQVLYGKNYEPQVGQNDEQVRIFSKTK
jgi:hypothetical protein